MGKERVCDFPDEWVLSVALSVFSEAKFPERGHEAFIKKLFRGEIVGHNLRDSNTIDARGNSIKQAKKQPRGRGRPQKKARACEKIDPHQSMVHI
jgi:hypothetical protein